DGGDGNDSIVYMGHGDATLNGGDGDDYIQSISDGNVTINGGAGNDYIINQGTGTATIHGDDGADQIIGGYRPANNYRKAGDDIITSGGGADTIYPGTGTNLVNLTIDSADSVVTNDVGDQATDTLFVTATTKSDTIQVLKLAANQSAIIIDGK